MTPTYLVVSEKSNGFTVALLQGDSEDVRYIVPDLKTAIKKAQRLQKSELIGSIQFELV